MAKKPRRPRNPEPVPEPTPIPEEPIVMPTDREVLQSVYNTIGTHLSGSVEPPPPVNPPTGDPIVASGDWLEIYQAGAVIENRTLNGNLTIKAPGVVLRGVTFQGTNPDTTLITCFDDTRLENCRIIGSPNGQHRGIRTDARGVRILNCEVLDIWKDIDTQAIGGWSGTRDLIVDGGIYEASGENILFGGATQESIDHICQDILIQNVTLRKKLEWRTKSRGETCKNLFELKSAKRVTLRNSILEYSWGDGQEGYAILLTVRQDPGPWSTIEDILIENCDISKCAAGITILGRDDYYQPHEEQDYLKRVLFKNNRFDLDGNQWGGSGRSILLLDKTEDLVFDGNQFLGQNLNTFITMGGMYPAHTRFVLTNNVAEEGEYGIFSDGGVMGAAALEKYCPGYTWINNQILNQDRGIVYPS